MDSHAWIAVGERDAEHGARIRQVFENACLLNPVRTITDSRELMAYLSGEGIYANRVKFPLPGMLLVDWKMLGCTAAETVRRIRSGSDGLPVIVLIDDGGEAELDEAYEAGATSYLRKPFTFADFLERSRIANVGFVILGGRR